MQITIRDDIIYTLTALDLLHVNTILAKQHCLTVLPYPTLDILQGNGGEWYRKAQQAKCMPR